MEIESPLEWPPGWPRMAAQSRKDSRYRFRRDAGLWTFKSASEAVSEEIDRLGGARIIITSNVVAGRRGGAANEEPADPGVAVYFKHDGQDKVMACDMHTRPAENLRSIALSIEALRTLERHGGGQMLRKAFTGFTALPKPKGWREVLDITASRPNRTEIEAMFRTKAMKAHPDKGGSTAAMAELNAARDAALREIGENA